MSYDKELAVQLALRANIKSPDLYKLTIGPTSIDALQSFAQAVYKLGRNAALDAAKQKCMAHGKGDYPAMFAEAIESLKDNTP